MKSSLISIVCNGAAPSLHETAQSTLAFLGVIWFISSKKKNHMHEYEEVIIIFCLMQFLDDKFG